ncbi:MAG: enoyl-CoA hydratase/isomerase family protein [Gammaproteobacteria bacterium]|nr:enoyl-CoA hydratase/isomerase family protein [Gammaproteobacteria bacterium]
MSDQGFETILYTVAEKVAHIRTNRPRYRNAQSRVMLEELDRAFALADQDPDVNVIVLSGAGDHFSAGHDLGTEEERADRAQRPWREGIRGWYERTYEQFYANTLRWRNVSKPTVCAVQGYCIFGGWMIASACDCIFAADDAMFLGSHFQYFALPWDLHPRKAKELLFESRFIDAREAMDLGLVNRVYPSDELLEKTLAWATQVAQNDPFLMRMSKLAVNHAEETQGFTAHTTAAHAYYTLARMGEYDPDSYIGDPNARRRPMVQVAMDNYHRARKP